MTSLKLTNSIPACHLQLVLSDPLQHWQMSPSSSSATFCYCHHLVHNITNALGQISSQLHSGLIALALLWLTHPTHYFGSTVSLEPYLFATSESVGSRSTTQAQLSTQSFLLFLCCPYLAHSTFKPIILWYMYLRMLEGPTYSKLNCFIRAVLVWPPHPQINAAILVNLVGPNYSGSAVFLSELLLVDHPPSITCCMYILMPTYQQLNHFIIATIISSSHISLALRLLGDAPTRPAYTFRWFVSHSFNFLVHTNHIVFHITTPPLPL